MFGQCSVLQVYAQSGHHYIGQAAQDYTNHRNRDRGDQGKGKVAFVVQIPPPRFQAGKTRPPA